MLLQQIKTWTSARILKLKACNRLDGRRAQTAERRVTWADASVDGAGKVAKETGEECSITAWRIKEVADDRAQASLLPQPDPRPGPADKTQVLSTLPNVTPLMQKLPYHAPIHIAVASCLPREDMWRPCKQPEQLEIPGAVLLESNDLPFHNPHDMLGRVSGRAYAVQSLGDPSWTEERDKNTLREYFKESTNIVLHSDCPHIAPHIVITPAEETPDDFYIPWNNRTHAQWSGFLMVPPYDLATGRLRPSYCQPGPSEPDNQSSDDSTLVDEGTMKAIGFLSKRVFYHSRFRSFVEATAYERLILYHVAKALQKHQCKAAAYAVSALAPTFCRRYEAPDFLVSIEKPFTWTDPAEPLLASIKLTLGATILESSCPFVAPHILINSPPPQNPWIPWHNAINDPQDGRYLIVPSSRVNYINMDEGEGEEPESRHMTSSTTSAKFFLASDDEEEEDTDDIQTGDADYEDEDDLEVDHPESPSPPPSRPSSPGPETPTDDTTFLCGFFSVRRPNFVIDEDDEDDRALALAIAKNPVEEYYHSPYSASIRVSLPVIEEEDSPLDAAVEGFSPRPSLTQVPVAHTDEDDGLPPLDGWYLGASQNAQTRTLMSTAAVA